MSLARRDCNLGGPLLWFKPYAAYHSVVKSNRQSVPARITIPRTLAKFEKKYAGERRTAIYRARFELGLTYKEIARRAKAGELLADDPFEISAEYLGSLCRDEEHRRAGRFSSPLADKPHRDAIEDLRRGLIAAADDLLSDWRATCKKKPGSADPGRGREIARLIREAAAIPAQKQETPEKPGAKTNGHQNEGPTRHGTAGALLNAMRSTTQSGPDLEPAQDDATTNEDHDADGGIGSLTHESATGLAA